MKALRFSCLLVIIVLAICSCKNSPSTMVMGNYEGAYSRDTVTVGAATSEVVEVNPLTINIIVDLANDPDFHMYNVEVNSDSVGYHFLYDGTQGTMTGTVLGNHMNWTLMSASDTITFHGDKVQ